jgi:3-isopropylmalate/(R)-2-methylmalate dehydratase large subunit
VFATQALLQRKPKSFAVNVEGRLHPGVTAKDLILAIIDRIGVSGGTGHVLEYRGSAVRALSMDERMTVCNMSIEAGARAGMVAPDETTFAYLEGKPRAPRGAQWDEAVARWRSFAGDADAPFDTAVDIDASLLEPMITYGTNPGMVLPIGGAIPDRTGDEAFDKALKYMGFHGGEAMLGKPVNVVFIGSCTNGRLEDLAKAAQILKGRKVAPGVRLLIVPGSQAVKRAAEAAGYADTFKAAGADWRESGCSMCLGMNGDTVAAGEYSVSTSNRNFEGRQGVGARTLLASPYTAAASAVRGLITDPREML